ncbi:hypothetical protein A9P82_00275 [Arachidicoccus ginsenosidimutans]|uniref:metallophosphoesterase n=1 Tax=Arachidicoccus sp. BS20 TaxID=1850526 RepID=UPI0007F0A5FB|nr:metallophosphoesterase [Arachidicoccus sp. BS20]ANI87893.1 hypothetical protein A9P82_00275 [Arachidicoccus sp. BS20]
MSSLFKRIFSHNKKEKNKFDGPYVFHKNNSIEIYTIEAGKCTKNEYKNEPLQVRFSNHADWNFSVPLKKQLSNEPCLWNDSEKIFVLSDIEGEFAAFRRLLIANNVIDSNYQWIFGKGHLVVNGDLFDRGDEVTPLLWLIYKLEDEAKLHGGYVHTIIGNHDVMNLSGDLRFVDIKYFNHARLMNMDYMQLFDKDSELGRWLRTKNVMEKIGNRLFVHGGVSPLINNMQLNIEILNAKCRPFYDISENEGNETNVPEYLQSLYNRQSLYWYRGYFYEPRATMQDVDNTLTLYGCKQIIVGHTIVPDKNPALYYTGKILGIDVNQHQGIHAAILIENDNCFAMNDKGEKKLLVYQPANEITPTETAG